MSVQSYEKNQKFCRKELENLLRKQKNRSVKQIEAYKLAVNSAVGCGCRWRGITPGPYCSLLIGFSK